MDSTQLNARYGPWALVTGASEGVGAAFSQQLAEAGLNVVLMSRRRPVLEQRAREIEESYGVQTRVLTGDLSLPNAASALADAVADLEIGLFISTPGADSHGTFFLDEPIEEWLALVRLNVITTLELCHRLCRPMAERGRGGVILLSSGAGLSGGGRIAVYSATKAFDRNLAEGLWWELGHDGVDVLGLALRGTATPAMLRQLEQRNITLEGLDDPAEVARTGLDRLGHGPTWFVGEDEGTTEEWWTSGRRRELVTSTSERSKAYFERGGEPHRGR